MRQGLIKMHVGHMAANLQGVCFVGFRTCG